jgi:TPR repeat protein
LEPIMKAVPAVLAALLVLAPAGFALAQTEAEAQAQLQNDTVADVTVTGQRPVDPTRNVPGRIVDIGKMAAPCTGMEEDVDNPCEQMGDLGAMLKKAYALYDAGDHEGALIAFRDIARRTDDYRIRSGEAQGLGFNPDVPLTGNLSFMRGTNFSKTLRSLSASRALTREAALMSAELYLNDSTLENGKGGISWLKRVAGDGRPTRKPTLDPAAPYAFKTMSQLASVWLATLYRHGDKVERDLAQSRGWYERAARLGYLPAWKALGDIYAEGLGVVKNDRQAATWYKKAADLGFSPATTALAALYAGGGEADKARAIALYQQAADAKDAEAAYALALMYEAGDGVAADPARAVGLYRIAAEAGDRRAQGAYGLHLYEGSATTRNLPEARRWLQQAAAAGEPEAIYNLAVMMARGEGGEKDMAKAWVLMKVAEAAGQTQAPTALAALERRMTADERASAEALFAPGGSPPQG